MTNEEAIKQLKKCKSFHNGSYGTAINLAIKALEQQPSTGHWIKMGEGFTPYECSECEAVEFKKSKYCPNCGADMRGEEE